MKDESVGQAYAHSPLLYEDVKMVRFRNLIVHEYTRIDDARAYGILQKRLGDFDAFAEAVATCLGKT